MFAYVSMRGRGYKVKGVNGLKPKIKSYILEFEELM
jgi:hypothetical protein